MGSFPDTEGAVSRNLSNFRRELELPPNSVKQKYPLKGLKENNTANT